MRGFALGTTIAIALSLQPTALFAATFQKITLSTDPAPGVPGASFFSFGMPKIDAAGDVLFRAVDSSQHDGIWFWKDGTLAKVAHRGDATPGRTGTFIGIDSNVDMNAAGQIAFGAGWSNSTLSTRAIWTGKPGALSVAVADRDPVPGLLRGWFEQPSINRPPAMDSDGQLAFYTSLDDGNVTIINNNDSGVWKWSSGSLEKILREGDAAPGTEFGVTFGSLNAFIPIRISNGKVAVKANVTGPGVNGFNFSGIWVGDGQTLTKIARDGDPAPRGEQFFNVAYDAGGSRPVLGVSDVGDIVFRATLASGKSGIFRSHNGVVESIVQSGDAAPGTGATFGTVASPVVTSLGRIAFWADLGTFDSPRASLWTWSDGVLKKIISEEEKPAEMPPGFEFFRLGGTEQVADILFLNDNGQLAFGSGVRNTVSGASYSTLWAHDPASGIHLLAGPGQTLEVAPGDVRSISADVFLDSPTSDGRFNSLNSSGPIGCQSGISDRRRSLSHFRPRTFDIDVVHNRSDCRPPPAAANERSRRCEVAGNGKASPARCG